MGRIHLSSLAVLILACQTALSAPPDLEKRLEGKQIRHFDGVVKATDTQDPMTEFPYTTYANCRDTYTYFIEPVEEEEYDGWPSYCQNPPKYRKVLHGLRIVYDEQGRLSRIENYWAGVLNGQEVVFRDGKLWYESTYKYGLGDGISRHYTPSGTLLLEEEFKDGKRVSSRSFKADGKPDRGLVIYGQSTRQ